VNNRPVVHVSQNVTARLALAATATAAALLLVVLTAGPASAHGAPTSPDSRSAACGAAGTEEESDACQAALEQSPRLATDWDNVRVPDVGGQDGEVIPDGELRSAGIARFSGLDLPRTDWPATTLTAGSSFRFDYRATIPHEGSFRLYMTRQGYDPGEPLTWSDLGGKPFLTATDPPETEGSYSFEGDLPTGLTGRHLIYTVWENSGSTDTYYSCSDVDFAATGSTGGGSTGVSGAAVPPVGDPGPDESAAVGRAAAGSTALPAADAPGQGLPLIAGSALLAILVVGGVLLVLRMRARRHG